MKIALNTSCAVAGGAVTHLKHLLPVLVPLLGQDELIVIGDAAAHRRIDPGGCANWHEIDPVSAGLAGRLAFENRDLPEILRGLRADVLFHPGNFSVFRSPIPQVNLLHNLAPFLPEVIAGESLAQKIRLRILRFLTLRSLRIAHRMIFISQWGRSLVLGGARADEGRFPIVPFGADHGRAPLDPATLARFELEADRFVLTVSHLYRYKKLENLIGAWVSLGERVRDLALVIVGEPYDAEYAGRMRELGRESRGRILFTGGLPEAELVSLMKACRAFVFTSEAENLPITLLEAMAAECAILTNRACSMPEVCADAVLYADPASPRSYEAGLSDLLRDDALREDLRRRAGHRANEFRWQNAAARTLAILRESAVGA
jgi:glycosyltransferase involved in cell wall biosynthesis